jgi:crooked neck
LQTAVEAVERKMPKKLKKKRKIQTDEGMDAGMEEYYDYVFPEEEGAASNLKFLERAQAWKRQKQMEATENGVS